MADIATKPRRTAHRDEDGLNQAERELVTHYTNPDADTYLNGSRSIKQTDGYHPTTDVSARSMAAEVLARPHVKNAVMAILDSYGMDYSVRIRQVADIARNGQRDNDKLNAHKLLFKLDGTEDMRKAEAHVLSDHIRKLSKRMLREKGQEGPPEKVVSDSSVIAVESRGEALRSAESNLDDITDADTQHARIDDAYAQGRAQGDGLEGERPGPSVCIPSPSSPLDTKTLRSLLQAQAELRGVGLAELLEEVGDAE